MTLDELLGAHPEREGELVDAVERRLEVLLDLELGRRGAGDDARLLAPGRAIVREGAGRAEPAPHVVGGQRGELAEGAHAEPAQQGRRARVDHEPHGQRGDEVGGCPGRHDPDGGLACGPRAACSAANGPSAMPTRAPGTPSSATVARRADAAASSPP